jgi:tetratricopeptide (TPR) repeat protein
MKQHVLEVVTMFKNLTLTVVLIAILLVVVLPIPQDAKSLLVVIILLGLVFYRRGYFYVAIASRALNGKHVDEEKAWRYYEKGWKAGLPPKYTVMLGNLFIQRGDVHVAVKILDSVIEKQKNAKKPDIGILASARISRSMASWVLGQVGEAIDILYAVRSEGQADKNLYINLTSYLLEERRLEEAWEIIEEAAGKMTESPGMTDNRGWYLLLTQQYKEADKLYNPLISDSKPRFPEAYVHAAQVKTALGKISKARELYEEALTKPFYQTTGISMEEVRALLKNLDSVQMEPDMIEDEDVEEFEEVLYEEDLFDDGSPNTDVDDEDDFDPNIELDDEDYRDYEDPEVDEDEDPDFESEIFEDEYEDEEEYHK